jgi:hypothetical protein
MGWLRDLMLSAQPPYRSFGALARASIAHAAWPGSVRAQPRSLATIYSKLDRDADLEWLSDRVDVQRVLSELLGCAVADVQSGLAAGPQPADRAVRRVRLDDLRYGRALDLVDELLPPGIPADVLRPDGWGRLWWLAPSGAGKTLAGRWLEVRGLATFVSGSSFETAGSPEAARAPLFVEVETSAGAPPARDRVCVAAPFSPPTAGDWAVVESPPVDAYLSELVEWVGDRLEGDGHFEPERAERWLRAVPLARGDIDALGTALGLCGLVDELGTRSLENRSLAEAARRYLERRLAEWRRNEGGDTAGVERRAFDVLLGIVSRTLTDDERPWNAARSFDEWMELVPPEHRHGADVDWLRLSLPQVDGAIRPSDVDKAARRLPPGAYRIMRALRGARILSPAGDEDRLVLSPRWLGVVAQREAGRALMAASPLEWGEALARPHAAAELRAALFERVRAGDVAPLEAVLELEDEENPACVLAMETSFVVAGLAALGGVELSAELVEELFGEQARLWVVLGGRLPRPRLLDTELFDAWYLAALVLGEQTSGTRDRTLVPWSAGPELPLAPLLAHVERFAAAAEPELYAAISALLDRLRRARGAVASHRLELAGALIAEVEAGSVGLDLVRRLDAPDRDARALARIAKQRELSIERVARALWEAWSRAGQPPLPPLLAGARALFEHVPPSLLVAVLDRAAADGVKLSLDALDDARWAVLLQAGPKLALGAHASTWFAEIPFAYAERALASGELPVPAAIHELWSRFPEAVSAAHMLRLATGDPERAVQLLAGAPDSQTTQLVRAWRERTALDRLSDACLGALREWLHARALARGDGWREAYAFLVDAERMLASSSAGS